MQHSCDRDTTICLSPQENTQIALITFPNGCCSASTTQNEHEPKYTCVDKIRCKVPKRKVQPNAGLKRGHSFKINSV